MHSAYIDCLSGQPVKSEHMIFGLNSAGMAGSVPGGAGGALWVGRAGLAVYGEPVAVFKKEGVWTCFE